MFGFNPAKCEVQCRSVLARIKLLRNKHTALLRALRAEVADQLRIGKYENAKIKVEAVIREDKTLKAYEILELYMELIAVRATLLGQAKTVPPDMVSAIATVIYAAARVPELPELSNVRAMFGSKFGKQLVAEASADETAGKMQVDARLVATVTVQPPDGETKLRMLIDIAAEHKVGDKWDEDMARADLLPPMMPNMAAAAGGMGGPAAGRGGPRLGHARRRNGRPGLDAQRRCGRHGPAAARAAPGRPAAGRAAAVRHHAADAEVRRRPLRCGAAAAAAAAHDGAAADDGATADGAAAGGAIGVRRGARAAVQGRRRRARRPAHRAVHHGTVDAQLGPRRAARAVSA